MSKKIFFFDVDGTLLDHSIQMDEPNEETFTAFKELREAGHEVVIATAREILPDFFPIEDLDGAILSNGFFIINEGEVIRNVHFSTEELQYIADLTKEYDAEYFFGGYSGSLISNADADLFVEQTERFGPKLGVVGRDNFEDVKINMATVLFHNEEQQQAYIERLPKEYDIHIYTGQTTHIDILLPGCSKGEAVKVLYEAKGYDREDTYAFGDGQNDIEMMENVGHGVAMGNGGQEIKAVADYIAETVDADGAVKKLRKLGFIK